MKKVFKELSTSHSSNIIVKEEVTLQFAAPFHFHKGYEFTYIVKGRGKFYGGNRLLNFKEGELYFFGVGFPHLFVNEKSFIEAKETAHSIIIQFEEGLFGHELTIRPEFEQVKRLLKTAYWGIKIDKPTAELRECLNGMKERAGLQVFITLLQMLDLIASLSKADMTLISSNALRSSRLTSTFDEKLEPVFHYVLENFKDKITTQTAAGLAFMNEAAFCRYFKRRTNKTLSQFVNQVRITHATYLLSANNKSIAEICYECGFENMSYFNRQFRVITGKTPSQCRKIEI